MSSATAGKFIAMESLGDIITIEHAESLADWMRHKQGFDVHLAKEPTEGPAGTLIKLARMRRIKISPRTMLFLSLSDKLDHLYDTREGFASMLQKNRHVLCSRYVLSEWAQALNFFDLDYLRQVYAVCPMPDLTFYIDVPVVKFLQRTGSDPYFISEFPSPQDELDRIRENYLRIGRTLKNEKQNIYRINGNAPFDTIQHAIRSIVDRFFHRQLSMG